MPADRTPTRLRVRLLRIALLPVLVVGALAGVLAATGAKDSADREVARQLEAAKRDALTRIAETAERMAGYGLALAQRRDLQGALAARDVAFLQAELTELFWDLRSLDPLVRRLVALDADGGTLAASHVAAQSVSLPEALAPAHGAIRVIGLLPGAATPTLGAVLPVIEPASGEQVGTLQVLARLDVGLARDIAEHLHAHAVLFMGGALAGGTLALDRAALPPWVASGLDSRVPRSGPLVVEDQDFLALLAPLLDTTGELRGHLLLALPSAALVEPATGLIKALLATAATILLLALPLTWRAARRLALPLEALAATLNELRAGRHDAPLPDVPPDAPGEIAALAEAVAGFRDTLQERERLAERLRWLATHDPVTDLANRHLFNERLLAALSAPERAQVGLAVVMVDLDLFKEVNDTHGHAAGDALLREVGQRLAASVRPGDTVARWGGDEFALILEGIGQVEAASALAERLIERLRAPVDLGGTTVLADASIGIAHAPAGQRRDAGELQREADLALYRAKTEGRGRHRLFDPAMDAQAAERRAIEADLRRALELGELRLVLQPQFAVADRRLLGGEALLRWRHPTRGEVRPDVFIAIAERAGLIVPIGRWVLEEAARLAAGLPGVRIALNVSPLQLRDPGFLGVLGEAIAGAGLGPGRLELEVTESVTVTDVAATAELFRRMRALGVRIALDDFGTGHSSLAQLQRFEFDKIKLDRAFVRPLAESETARTLLRAVVAMTEALGVRLNAEGVETEEQLRVLQEAGCAEAQGYLLGRPMERQDFVRLVGGAAGWSRDAA